jgi:nucleotide-binding universal stress UspA family protein
MYQKILTAMDLSAMGEIVFTEALSLAAKYEATLLLLHVLSHEEDYSPLPIPPNLADIYPAQGNDLTLESWRQQWEAFEQQGLEMLHKRAKLVGEQAVKGEYRQIYGQAARTICRLAKEERVDLVVIGRRGRSGIGEFFLGSVSNYVLHHAPCSVLIVQHPQSEKSERIEFS